MPPQEAVKSFPPGRIHGFDAHAYTPDQEIVGVNIFVIKRLDRGDRKSDNTFPLLLHSGY